MKKLMKRIGSYLGAGRTRRGLVQALAVLVVFSTTYSLVLPAITKTVSLSGELDGVSVRVEAQGRAVPAGTELVLRPVLLSGGPEAELLGLSESAGEPRCLTQEEIDLILEAALDGDEEMEAVILRALDISLMHNGEEIEPADAVRLVLKSDLIREASRPVVVHLDDEGTATLVTDMSEDGQALIQMGEFVEEEPDLPDGSQEPGEEPDGSQEPGEEPDGSQEPGEEPDGFQEPGEEPDGSQEPGEEPDGSQEPGEEPDDSREPGENAGTSEEPKDDGNAPEEDKETPAEPDEAGKESGEDPSEEPAPEREDEAGEPAPVPEPETEAGGEITAEVDGFSVYAIVDLIPRAEGTDPFQEPQAETVEFTGSVDDMDVFVTAPAAAFPQETTMQVTMVPVEEVEAQVSEAMTGEIKVVKAVDIAFYSAEGEEIEPSEPISVVMRPHEQIAEIADAENDAQLVHIGREETTVVGTAAVTADEVSFESGEFSTYVIVIPLGKPGTQTYTGEGVTITVSYGPEANLPEGTNLVVRELEEGSSEYDEYLAKTQSALNLDASVISMEDVSLEAQLAALMGGEQKIEKARFFDITLEHNGEKVEPAAPVSVEIKYDDAEEAEGVQIVHFAEEEDGTERPEIITPTVEDGTVIFQQSSFSLDAVTIANAFGNAGWVKDGRMEILYGHRYMMPGSTSQSYLANVAPAGSVPVFELTYLKNGTHPFETGYPTTSSNGIFHPGTTIEQIINAMKINPNASQLAGVTIDFMMSATYDVSNNNQAINGHPANGATEVWDASRLGGVKITRGGGFAGYLIDMHQNTPAMQMKGNVIIDNAAKQIGAYSGFDANGTISQPVAIQIRDGGLLMMINGSHITDSTTTDSKFGTGVLLTSTKVKPGEPFNPSTQGGNIEIFNLEGNTGGTSSYISKMAVAIEQQIGETRLKTASNPFQNNTVGVALHHGNSIGKWEDKVPDGVRVPVFLRDVEKWKSGDIVMNSGYTPPAVHKKVLPADANKLVFMNIGSTNTRMGLEYYAGSEQGTYPVIRFYVGTVLNTRTGEWYATLGDAVRGQNPVKAPNDARPSQEFIKDGDTLVFYGNTLEGVDVNIKHNLTIRSSYSGELPTDNRSGTACTALIDGTTINIAAGKTVTFGDNEHETGLTLDGSSSKNIITNNGTLNLKDGITLNGAKEYGVYQNGTFRLYDGAKLQGNKTADVYLHSNGKADGNHYITLEGTKPNDGAKVSVDLGNSETWYNGRDVVVAGEGNSNTLDAKNLADFPLVNSDKVEEDYEYLYHLTGGPNQERVLELKMKQSVEIKIYKFEAGNEDIALENAEFAVYQDGKEYVLAGKPVKGTTNADGSLTLAVREGSFTLRETKAPEGYDGLSGSISFTVTKSGDTLTVTSDSGYFKDNVFKVPNTAKTARVQLLKTDGANPLPGASFELYDVNPADHPEAMPVFTGTSVDVTGIVTADGGYNELTLLMGRTYYLKETAAPEGYLPMSEVSTIRITEAGAELSPQALKGEDVNGIYVITIPNNPGKPLPNTGGAGTALYTVTGLGLMAAAALALELKRRGSGRA
ncbi:SpaA isopeptide-forming pilin-related protein [Oscillospiraceae bacterium 44-34]